MHLSVHTSISLVREVKVPKLSWQERISTKGGEYLSLFSPDSPVQSLSPLEENNLLRAAKQEIGPTRGVGRPYGELLATVLNATNPWRTSLQNN